MSNNEEKRNLFKVVFNHEEQYSIWPVQREIPHGWNDAGVSGSKEECLTYIAKVWTDMQPASLRTQTSDRPQYGHSSQIKVMYN